MAEEPQQKRFHVFGNVQTCFSYVPQPIIIVRFSATLLVAPGFDTLSLGRFYTPESTVSTAVAGHVLQRNLFEYSWLALLYSGQKSLGLNFFDRNSFRDYYHKQW